MGAVTSYLRIGARAPHASHTRGTRRRRATAAFARAVAQIAAHDAT
jgi:hypothetical protein